MKKVKYIKRRLWAFFLSVALLAGTMPAIISAQDSNVSNTLLQEATGKYHSWTGTLNPLIM